MMIRGLRSIVRPHFFVLAGLLLVGSGCQNNEIPLVEFPNGPPPQPPAAKADPNGPQGSNTSQGDPMQYSK